MSKKKNLKDQHIKGFQDSISQSHTGVIGITKEEEKTWKVL